MTTPPPFTLLARSFAGGPRPRNAAILLGGLWLAIFFAALWTPPVLDDADATHASAARAIATTGDLVTLRVDGVRYLEKAPLPYWLTALSFRIFGFNTFATHLPQALAVMLLALLGHRWANQAFGARTAFYTAISILTSLGVFLFTRILIPEVLLSLLLGAALFAMLRALTIQEPAPATLPSSHATPEVAEQPAIVWYAGGAFYSYLMWSSLGLAVLTKGLVALVFFAATAILYLTFTGSFRDWRRLRPFTGSLLFLAIAAPWHILAGLRNTGGSDGHGFFWFYFVNEHVLRFLGRRNPADFNKLPGYLYWSLHLVWLFPWALFLPLGVTALHRRYSHQTGVLTSHIPQEKKNAGFLLLSLLLGVLLVVKLSFQLDLASYMILALAAVYFVEVFRQRRIAGLESSPFHRIDLQQRSILLLSLFAGIVLVFFSLSTNQEYYTFPAWMPILLLLSATITRAEQTYLHNPSGQRWITFAHAAFAAIGLLVSFALAYGLWVSRALPYVPDIGAHLAHRGVGNYTLSMSHFFDLTGESFAALRLPAVLASIALTVGPGVAWMLRMQRRHLAATTSIAFTSAAFLIAAHIAFARFAPMLSSQDFAAKIEALEASHLVAQDTEVMLYGDQAFGSSIPFYLGRPVFLVNARSTSMLFGSSFPDVPPIFLSDGDLVRSWGTGARKILFVPLELRDQVDRLLGTRQIVLQQMSGKALITDRPLTASP
jgi:4-amino-4-deoxy-L-arabinose transferase-like glycosyltransferase